MTSVFGGAKSLRAAAGVIAAAASSAADLRHVDGLKESMHSAASDALRMMKEITSVNDEEKVIHNVASLFFEIVSLELKSQENLRQRLSRAESELDFASAQLRRRDAFIASMREDMLRDIQSANELVRQYVTKYNDLVAEGSRSTTSGAAGTSLSKKASKYGSSMETSSQQESTSEPTSPVVPMIPMPRLADTKEIEKRLDLEQAAAMVEPDKKTQEQVMRETMERKLKDIQIRLQREHDVLLHRTAKRGDEMLKTECAKLESKVRQLEQQLRRKEADAELQLQKERDRWRLQMQRATETAKATLASKLWFVVKDLESSKMEVHDVLGHAEATNAALRERIRELEQQLLHARKQGSTQAADGSVSPKESQSMLAAQDNNNNVSSIEGSTHTTFAGLTPSAPKTRGGRPSVAFDSPLGKATGDLGRSPRRRRVSRGNSTSVTKHGNRMSVLSASTSSAGRFGALDETAALKDTVETLRRNLTIAVLARDEAIAERDALAEELTLGPDAPAVAALLRGGKSAYGGSNANASTAGGGEQPTTATRSVEALVRVVDTDLRRMLTEFTNGRNDVLLSLQTKMARHMRRASSYSTTSPRMPEEDLSTAGGASSARHLRSLTTTADQQRQFLFDTRSPFRLDSARLPPTPTDTDFSDVLRVTGMSPRQRPPSAGRLRTSTAPATGFHSLGSPPPTASVDQGDASGPSSPLEDM